MPSIESDQDENLRAAVAACLGGRLTALEVGCAVATLIGPPDPVWNALGGPEGALAPFFKAQDMAGRLVLVGPDVDLWHPSVREAKRKQVEEAEAAIGPAVADACRALPDFAGRERAKA